MSIYRLSTNYTFLRSLNTVSDAFERIVELQEKMVTGKQINRPSDDPPGMEKIFSFNTSIKQNEQFIRNIDRSIGRLQIASTTLQQVEDLLIEVREIALHCKEQDWKEPLLFDSFTDKELSGELAKELKADLRDTQVLYTLNK